MTKDASTHNNGLIDTKDSNVINTLDTLLEGCQIISPEWRYLYVNETVAKQGKQTKENLLGKTMMEMYPGIEHTEMFGVLRKCLLERTAQIMENEFTFPDGSKGWFELRMEPVSEGVFILSLDITEKMKMNELKKQEAIVKAREEFLFQTIHDLQSPTNIIKMVLADGLRNNFAKKYPETEESFSMIQEVNERMEKLISYLFKYARGEKRDIRLDNEHVDINDIIETSIHQLKLSIEQKNIKTTHKKYKNTKVVGNKDLLAEVFNNLIENAIKYNKDGGSIEVDCIEDKDNLLIKIKDSGVGIESEYMEKLFDPYFRAYSGRDIKGNGLGLFIVKGLVEKMNGSAKVESVFGSGTTITISLPLAK